MSKIENAVKWAIGIAEDNTHGYDQGNRWGMDYDCSGLVITAFEKAGVPVKTKGATYTGNMLAVFKKCGFEDVTSSVNLSTGAGLKRGDVLLKSGSHTAIYIGDGKLVHASINEKGKALGGEVGDQTGKEICTRSYYNKPWGNILRYTEEESAKETAPTKVSSKDPKVGDTVKFTGTLHYTSSYATAVAKACKAGSAKITAVAEGRPHPYHLKAVLGKGSTVNGWVNAKDIG